VSSGSGFGAFRYHRSRVAVALTLILAAARPVLAQMPSLAAGIAQPPAGSPIERLSPKQLAPVSPSGINPTAPDEGEVPNIPIDVRRVEITGATLFGDDLRQYVSGLTGPARPLTQLNKARQDILLHYRSRGYVLSAVSMAIDRGTGTVIYRVTEGRIVAVKLDGDIGPAGTMVLHFLNHLTEEPAVNAATLERYLLLAQDVPGVSLSTVLEPSTTDPGALTLIAQVSLQHVSGQVSADNRAFNQTGPIQFLGIVDLNSLSAWGDKTELSYYHSFPNSQNFGQVSTEWFIGSSGLKIRLYGGAGVLNPTGSLGALEYHGTTNVFGTQLSYPVIRSRQQNLNIYTSLDGLESTVDTGAPAIQSSADEVRALRIGEDYIGSDIFLGGARPATNQLSARLSQGLEILGGYHGTALPPSTARANEQHNFTAIRFEASRTQTLYTPWAGASIALKGLITGQWTPDVLPPAEEFYLGGSRFTRGFYSGQVPGDKALAATAELQLNTTVDLTKLGSHADIASQFYVFYDWGETWQNQSIDFAARLSSAGGGARMQITRFVEVDLEALARFTQRPPPATSDMNGIGLYWRLVGRY
jgi:hemolysin activation/secretion protein